MKIQVFTRNVYGQIKVYPADKTAQQFANLIGVKTFNHSQLISIEAMGYTIEQVIDPQSRIAA